jgi:AcrR family transcriptional regulator
MEQSGMSLPQPSKPVKGSLHAIRRRPDRMSREERSQSIVKAAIAFFAEHGFGGQTRELAARAGITQALLYRHFSSKDAIIERVYREVFLSNWKPEWEELIGDRNVPLRDRLVHFYQDYTRLIMKYEWIRLYLFFGLDGRLDFSKRYLKFMHERIWWRIIAEIRHHSGRPSLDFEPIKVIEVELVWALVASIFHIGVRCFVLGLTVPEDLDSIIEGKVHGFLDGAPAAMASSSSSREAVFDLLPNL